MTLECKVSKFVTEITLRPIKESGNVSLNATCKRNASQVTADHFEWTLSLCFCTFLCCQNECFSQRRINKVFILKCACSICRYLLAPWEFRKGEKRQWCFTCEKMQIYSLFSKEAVVITEVDQGLIVEGKAADTISHRKALKAYVFSWTLKIHF